MRVALVCDVAAGGSLAGCSVNHGEPPGQGYGQGALALAPEVPGHFPGACRRRTHVGAKVRVPIRFELTQVAAPKG